MLTGKPPCIYKRYRIVCRYSLRNGHLFRIRVFANVSINAMV